ncbi:MAG: autotransporter assembly complex family protein [Halofilum sp. (in: g-proteobacteria)]|nr:autotransporter assembly complex family protein [Halofilum sp. (in: g-proteobacteria)]
MPRLKRPLAGMILTLASVVWWSSAHAEAVDVAIEGVEGALLDNVRAMLSIAADRSDDEEVTERSVRRLHRRAPDEIRRALEPFGHYQPEIDTNLVRDDDGAWQAGYRIDPGPRVKFTEVTIDIRGEAADDRAFADLRDELVLAEGEPLVHADYDTAKQRIMELAAARGYFDATWKSNVLQIDPKALEARAELVLDSGQRYAFGEVTFEQNELDDGFLRGFVPFEPGDPWESERVLDLQYALDDSDYFLRVDVRPQRDQARAGRVPVRVRLEPRPRNRYTFGIGFGTNTGARVSAGWENRRFNRSGHSFDTRVEVAEVSNRLSARYRIPLADPARERLVFESSLGTEEIGDAETRQFEIGARRIEQRGRYQASVSLDYQRNEDTIGDETTQRNLVMPGAGLSYSRFDDPIYATRGFRLGGYLSGGAETLGSDVSFLRGRLQGDGVLRLWDGGRLLLRGEIGTVEVDDVDRLPLSRRFFTGGDDSVRGFDYQSLGPVNEDGDVIGGRHLAVGSIELEQLITGNWGAAVFMDAGNAMNDWSVNLRRAAGVGLRYRSPVGMFRVDVARAIDGDESPRLHLSLGVDL